jgi:hypothetical protein
MIQKILTVIPVILITTLCNVFISTIVAYEIMLHLLSKGYGNWSLWGGIISAIAVYSYITFNHRLRLLIK